MIYSHIRLLVLAAIAALPGVPGIFIENIQTDLGTGSLEIRVGYFGMVIFFFGFL